VKTLAPPAPESSDAARLAVLLLAGVVAALNIGKLPPALPALQQSFGMTLVQASFLVSVFQAAGMGFGLFGGVLADRFGARRVMGCGLGLLALASVAGALSADAGTLLAMRAIESAGFILTVLPGPALIRRVVPFGSLGVALGYWGSYMPTGMSLALVATPWLMAAGGWQLAWWCSASAALATLVLLRRVVAPDPPHGAEPVRVLALARDTLRAPGPWLLAACFGLYAGQFIAVFGFLPTAYQSAGIAPTTAGLLTAFGVAANMSGNIVSGLLLHRGATRTAVLAGASLVMGVATVIAFDVEFAFGWRYAAVLLFSAVGGLIPGTLFTTAPRFAPYAGAVSTTTGLMQQGSAIGQFISPPLVAAVASSAGGWHHTWWVTSAFALVNIVVAVLIGRRDRRLVAR
jgi:predicted MFS family arabinose efflux permease